MSEIVAKNNINQEIDSLIDRLDENGLNLLYQKALHSKISNLEESVKGLGDEIGKMGVSVSIVKKTSQINSEKTDQNKEEIQKINKARETDEITGAQSNEVEKERRRRAIHLLGGIDSNKYKLFGSYYFKYIGNIIKQKFSHNDKPLSAFNHIKKKDYNKVINFIRHYTPDEDKIKHKVITEMLILRDKTDELHNKINNNNLSRAEELKFTTQIVKNEKKLEVFNRYMSK